MSRKRRMLCGLLALGLLVPVLAGRRAWAAPLFTADPDKGQTTVGVWVTDENINSMSVEVPLYVTLAVVRSAGGNDEVLAPAEDKYYLTNNSNELDVAVTGLSVEPLTPGDRLQWELTGGDPAAFNHAAASERQIALSLTLRVAEGPDDGNGNPTMIDKPLWLDEGALTLDENGPFKLSATEWRAIQKGQRLTLGWAGAAKASNDTLGSPISATAQFRLVYTFSALQSNGTPLGVADFVTYEDIDLTNPNP